MYVGKNEGKSPWVLLLFVLAGIVLGGFIGEYAGALPFMGFLKYGGDFGIKDPIVLDLGVILLKLAFTIRFTISGILGMVLAVFIYKKI